MTKDDICARLTQEVERLLAENIRLGQEKQQDISIWLKAQSDYQGTIRLFREENAKLTAELRVQIQALRDEQAYILDLERGGDALRARVKALEEGLGEGLTMVENDRTLWTQEWLVWAEDTRALLTPATEKAWPPGFFVIGRRIDLRCATENCGQTVSVRMELGGVGSDYCEPCARKIADMTATEKGGE